MNEPSSGKTAATSAMHVLAGFGTTQVLRFAANIILARLLVPEAFGLMALVNVINQGLQMVSDTGVWVCVVQSKRGNDRDFLQTAWTLQVIRGVLLAIIAVLIAWPTAWLYGEPRLLPLLAVSGLTSAIAGFKSSAVFTAYRRIALGRMVVIDLISYAVSMGVAVFWVWCVPTVWALVVAGILASLLQVVLSYQLLPAAQHRFRLDKGAVRELVHFGRWIFLNTLFTFLASQADRLIVGGMVSLTTLGLYHIALMFASLPAVLLGNLCSSVLLPYYSRLDDAGQDASRRGRLVHWAGSLFAWSLSALVLLGGPALINLLYRGPYEAVIPMLRILAFTCWFQMLQNMASAMLLAEGRSQSTAQINFIKLVAMLILVPVAACCGGLTAVLWTFMGVEVLRYLLTCLAMRKALFQPLGNGLVLTGLLIMVDVAGFTLDGTLAAGWGSMPRLLAAGGLVAAPTIAIAVGVWLRHGRLVVSAAS